ncbi:hypothetical protein ACLOJK_027355 [Asimina triloba]
MEARSSGDGAVEGVADGGAAGVDIVGCCRGRAELTEVADGGANRPCYCRWKTKMDRPIWDRWPSDLDLEGRSGEDLGVAAGEMLVGFACLGMMELMGSARA